MVTASASRCPGIVIAAFVGCRALFRLDLFHCEFLRMYNCLSSFLLSCQVGTGGDCSLEDGICVYSALSADHNVVDEDCY